MDMWRWLRLSVVISINLSLFLRHTNLDVILSHSPYERNLPRKIDSIYTDNHLFLLQKQKQKAQQFLVDIKCAYECVQGHFITRTQFCNSKLLILALKHKFVLPEPTSSHTQSNKGWDEPLVCRRNFCRLHRLWTIIPPFERAGLGLQKADPPWNLGGTL